MKIRRCARFVLAATIITVFLNASFFVDSRYDMKLSQPHPLDQASKYSLSFSIYSFFPVILYIQIAKVEIDCQRFHQMDRNDISKTCM